MGPSLTQLLPGIFQIRDGKGEPFIWDAEWKADLRPADEQSLPHSKAGEDGAGQRREWLGGEQKAWTPAQGQLSPQACHWVTQYMSCILSILRTRVFNIHLKEICEHTPSS